MVGATLAPQFDLKNCHCVTKIFTLGAGILHIPKISLMAWGGGGGGLNVNSGASIFKSEMFMLFTYV